MKNKIEIPKPFNKFYKVASAEQAVKAMGWNSLKEYQEGCDDNDSKYGIYGVEDNLGYQLKHLAWIIGRAKYFDKLADNDLAVLELALDGNEIIFAYQAGGRIFDQKYEIADLFNLIID